MADEIRITPENEQLFRQLLANHDQFKRYQAQVQQGSGEPLAGVQFLKANVSEAGPAKPAKGAKKKASSSFHENRRRLDERAFYPPHDARESSSAYRRVHEEMVMEGGCLVCDVTNDILKDPSKRADLSLNPYGAIQLETHHHVIEWALANAIDPDKFNKRIFPFLQKRHGKDRYPHPLDPKEVPEWVDHSKDNLWVLCDVHHRAKFFGIHEITDPIWGPQDILSDEFLKRVRDAIAKEGKTQKGKRPPKATKKGKKRVSKK
jgi:hypothetical protein